MSHKRIRETTLSKNLSVASKCLAIVLISKGRKSSQDNPSHEWDDTVVDTTDGNVIVQSSEVQKALSPNGYNGKELLQDFKIRNKTCYWNPSLVESIKSLEYKGFVEPSTILVSGEDIHIENIRSAWGRRVLKAPGGFVIERIGDVNGIQMQEIPQTQFMPLPDALCSVVMELNVQRVVATLDVILDKLSLWYRDMTLPDHQVIVDILGALIKDRKVFHTGSGYFVVTPDTNRLPNGPSNNSTYMPTNASWLPYHPMYVPVFQGQAGPPVLPTGSTLPPGPPPSRSHMRSISCQVTTIEETESEGEDEREKVAKIGGGGGNKGSTLTRSSRPQSFRQNKPSKDSKQAVEKDKENKNNGGGKGGKGGGQVDGKAPPATKIKEKTSLLSKIFGRNKKKTNNTQQQQQQQQQQNHQVPSDTALMPPPALPPPPPCQPVPIPTTATMGKSQTTATDIGMGSGKSVEPPEKEYATFSAQFPPAEWAWYQQQLEKQKRTENWVTHQSSKATVVSSSNQMASSTLSRRPPQGSNDRHGRKSLMPLNNHQVEYLSMNDVNPGGQKNNPIPLGSLQYDGEFLKPDNLYESFRNNTNNPHSSKQRQRNNHHRKSRDLDFIGEENAQPHHLKHHPHHHHPSHHHNGRHKKMSDYDVIDQADITPVNGSNVYNSVSGLSPVSLFSDESASYAKLAERHHQHHHPNLGPLHSTPRYGGNGPASGLNHGYGERNAFKLEGHESRDRIYGGGPSEFSHSKRRSHRSRRRNQRAYSFYSGNGDDISIEYNGRLPNKNSSRVQSRDSGVNCMGLGKNNANPGQKQQGAELYENTPANKKHPHSKKLPHNNQGPSGEGLKPPGADSSHVRFDINNLTCATDSMAIDPYASTTSVAYQSEVTNPAFSSVVYGSSLCTTTGNFADNESTIGPIGSSVMYQTITSSALEPSELLPGPQPSPQSGFYEDGSCGVSMIHPSNYPGGEVVTIQHEMTQGDTEEYIDVEGGTIPDIREVAGSSNGMLEIAAEDEDDEDNGTKVGGTCEGREGGVGVSIGGGEDSNQDVDVEDCGNDGDNRKDKRVVGGGEDIVNVLDIADREGDGKPSQSVDISNRIIKDTNKVARDGVSISISHNKVGELKQINGISSTAISKQSNNGNTILPVDRGVADSGFNSPRNPDTATPSSTSSSSSSSDPRAQVSGQSQSLSDHSSGDHNNAGHPITETSDGQHPISISEDTTTTESSEGHHTQSDDIHMATSSEHHSGSTNDNGELQSEDSSSIGGGKRSQYHHDYTYNSHHQPHHHNNQQQQQQQVVKYRHSSSNYSGGSSCSSSHSYPYHPPSHRQAVQSSHPHAPPPPPASAKIITHPDVFNNNHPNVSTSIPVSSTNMMASYGSHQPPQLLHAPHPAISNTTATIPTHHHPMVRGSSQSLYAMPTSASNGLGWSSSSVPKTASQLHLFEEEQRSKNYGGDFEVMGVL